MSLNFALLPPTRNHHGCTQAAVKFSIIARRFAARALAVPALILLLALLSSHSASAQQPSLTVFPSAVSNEYPGFVTLQISGLTNGEQVLIGKFLDVNANGVIDSEDQQVQAFRLTDGEAKVIGGVTNLNVPGDWDTQAGSIRVPLSFPGSGIDQQIVGRYLYAMASPGGRFDPVLAQFGITNSPYSQSISGTVRSGGNGVPYATVLLFTPPSGDGGMNPVAGANANASGDYSIKTAPGTYLLWAFKSNYVADLTAAPVVTLQAGNSLTASIDLQPATSSISGRLVDADNPVKGLPSILVAWQSANGSLAAGFCDTNGDFHVPVTAGQWEFSGPDEPLAFHGYLGLQTSPSADTTTGSVAGVSIAFPKATALFWGRVTDPLGQPLPGLSLSAGQNDWNGLYESSATTDENGYYFLGANAGVWQVDIENNNTVYANYAFSSPPGDMNLADGQAVAVNFVGAIAPSHITGSVVDNLGNPIGNVGVYAYVNVNGTNVFINGGTDGSGNYSLAVPNGTWNVAVSCNGGTEALQTRGYLCVPDQTVTLSYSTAVVNFVAVSANIPQPQLVPVTPRPPGQFVFSFNSEPGVTYTSQYSSDLSNWTSFSTDSGSGGPITVTDPNAGEQHRFYRVRVGP